MVNSIIYKEIPLSELILDIGELSGRLKVPRDHDMSLWEKYKKELEEKIECKMSAKKVPVKYNGDTLIIGNVEAKSEDLKKSIKGSNEAFVFAVTLGSAVDRLLLKYSKISPSSAFIIDALASAYAEAAADRAQEILDGIAKTKVRFSPGYGDLPLEIQPEILEMINAGKLLSITLTDSLLMKPQKTITAIAGIE